MSPARRAFSFASKFGEFLLNSKLRTSISNKFFKKRPKAFRTDTVTQNNSGLIVTRTAWRAKVDRANRRISSTVLESHHGIGHQHQHRFPEFAT
ncbi:hypothetical protein [Massilia sp. METH4]|uniref:hypothetical protein n=1 Tax=Massilia sp. METH4 TaxID=3123041 RepID=UPI0030D22E34